MEGEVNTLEGEVNTLEGEVNTLRRGLASRPLGNEACAPPAGLRPGASVRLHQRRGPAPHSSRAKQAACRMKLRQIRSWHTA